MGWEAIDDIRLWGAVATQKEPAAVPRTVSDGVPVQMRVPYTVPGVPVQRMTLPYFFVKKKG